MRDDPTACIACTDCLKRVLAQLQKSIASDYRGYRVDRCIRDIEDTLARIGAEEKSEP